MGDTARAFARPYWMTAFSERSRSSHSGEVTGIGGEQASTGMALRAYVRESNTRPEQAEHEADRLELPRGQSSYSGSPFHSDPSR